MILIYLVANLKKANLSLTLSKIKLESPLSGTNSLRSCIVETTMLQQKSQNIRIWGKDLIKFCSVVTSATGAPKRFIIGSSPMLWNNCQ